MDNEMVVGTGTSELEATLETVERGKHYVWWACMIMLGVKNRLMFFTLTVSQKSPEVYLLEYDNTSLLKSQAE